MNYTESPKGFRQPALSVDANLIKLYVAANTGIAVSAAAEKRRYWKSGC